MILEHVAINLEDARAMAAWYVEHCGMSYIRKTDTIPYIHFLLDSSGQSVIELYSNPEVPLPDYRNMKPRILHFAFVVEDMQTEHQRLITAGATALGDIETLPDGSQLCFMRDPWGLTIQLAKRSTPLV